MAIQRQQPWGIAALHRSKHLQQVSRVALNLPPGLPFVEWQAIGEQLYSLGDAVQWWIGDWLNYGEAAYGEKYSQALDATNYDYQTLRDFAWVARRVELSFRNDNLSWSHHRAVAPLEPDEQDTVLKKAATNGWSVGEMRAAVQEVKRAVVAPFPETCTVDDLDKLVAQGRKFGTLYVDPPWPYGNQSTRAATDNHYPTMELEEIAALPVNKLAADQSHLHLWTTNAFLHDSFHLIEQWGFEFKSLLVWDKDKFGIGNYWRLQTEYLLLGTKGGLTFLNHAQPNIVRLARAQHSAKPEAIRKMLEKVSPGPRLEMFARRVATGWTCWGNEIARTMFDADVEEVA